MPTKCCAVLPLPVNLHPAGKKKPARKPVFSCHIQLTAYWLAPEAGAAAEAPASEAAASGAEAAAPVSLAATAAPVSDAAAAGAEAADVSLAAGAAD
jgi:hypothetical protein